MALPEDASTLLKGLQAVHASKTAHATPVSSLVPPLSLLRRWIHAHPEPGFEEATTAAVVVAALQHMGVPPQDIHEGVAGTGVFVDMDATSTAPGGEANVVRRIGLRADMDCLRMTEGNATLAHRSTRKGLAHACGHDGHVVCLIGAAHRLWNLRSAFKPGTGVRLLFQPAEEGPGGAKPMVDAGALEGLCEVYAMHNLPIVPRGTVVVKTGPVMSHTAEFNIRVAGTGGHGGLPAVGTDALLAAAHMVVTLQSVVSRSVPGTESAVLSVCMMHGGESCNVMPSQVKLGGTIRDVNEGVFRTVCRRLREVVHGVAAAFQVEAEVDIESGYPAVINTRVATDAVIRVAHSMHKEDRGAMVGAGAGAGAGADASSGASEEPKHPPVSSRMLPAPGGDDFAVMLNHVGEGCYFNFGTGEAGRGNAMLHTPHMDFNDNAIGDIVTFWERLVLDRIGNRDSG